MGKKEPIKIFSAHITSKPNIVPFVSIVIITRNRVNILSDCLEKLEQQTYQNFETIVVDSSNNVDTKELIKKHPQVMYLSIWDGRNNMPMARNLGISKALGEIVAFIDDDSMVFPNWLENIISGYLENDQIGGVGGCTIDERYDSYLKGEDVGTVYPDGRVIHNYSIDIEKPLFVDWFEGCNMSFRRSILLDLGGFDQKYTGDNSFEDVDMSARVRQQGHKLLLVPSAIVHHIRVPRDADVVARDWESPRLRFHQAHNRAYFVLKNFGINKVFIKYVLNQIKGLAVYAIKKQDMQTWERFIATFRGFVSGFWDSSFYRRKKETREQLIRHTLE